LQIPCQKGSSPRFRGQAQTFCSAVSVKTAHPRFCRRSGRGKGRAAGRMEEVISLQDMIIPDPSRVFGAPAAARAFLRAFSMCPFSAGRLLVLGTSAPRAEDGEADGRGSPAHAPCRFLHGIRKKVRGGSAADVVLLQLVLEVADRYAEACRGLCPVSLELGQTAQDRLLLELLDRALQASPAKPAYLVRFLE